MTTDPKFVAMMNDSKASLRIEGIIKGKVNKLLSEVTLEAQVFVKDSSKTVKQHVNQNGGNLLTYVRYQVGEGIEKKVVDFAEEVASQMNNI
jgi:elongation factor Ts